MIRNLFITAIRKLRKNKFFSLLNIFGLAVGMAVFLLIAQYARFERSYENFIPGRENIYRVSLTAYRNNELIMASEDKRINKIVVNEKLVQTAGFASTEAAVGKRIWIGWGSGNSEIAGVVANFNVTSLHDEIGQTVIGEDPRAYGEANIKIEKKSDLPQTLAGIESAWKKTFPESVFTFKFLDEQIGAFYKSEARLYSLFKIFCRPCHAYFMSRALGSCGFCCTTKNKRDRYKKNTWRQCFGHCNTFIKRLSENSCACAHLLHVRLPGILCINGYKILLIASI